MFGTAVSKIVNQVRGMTTARIASQQLRVGSVRSYGRPPSRPPPMPRCPGGDGSALWSEAVATRGVSDGSQAGDGSLMQSMTLLAPSEEATGVAAEILAFDNAPGDCYCLFGAVGAGKSTFSRAFIRASADDDDLVVPSPTFLLQNMYNEHEGVPVHHFDLYRLTGAPDLGRLSFDQSFTQAVSLIEWAERLKDQKPSARMDVQIQVFDAAELPEHLQGRLPAGGQPSAPEAEDDPYADRKVRVLTLNAFGRRMTDKLSGLRGAMNLLGEDLEGLAAVPHEHMMLRAGNEP